MKKSIDVEKKYRWYLFTLLFALSIAYSAIVDIREYQYDSLYYWTIADPVFFEGFNISAFPETFRGYFFTMIVSAAKLIFGGVWGWRVLSSVGISVCFAFLLPYLIDGHFPNSWKYVARCVIAYLVYMVIWGNLMQYPLSDFPAAFFIMAGVVVLKKIDFNDGMIHISLKAICVGCLFYAAYNTRVAYMFGVFILICLFILNNYKNLKKAFILCVPIMLGVFLIALPQCIINKIHVGTFSPKVYTEQFFGYSQDLQSTQLLWGLNYSHYETYIGELDSYPSVSVYYVDAVGKALIQRNDISNSKIGLIAIAELFIKHPLDMLGLYVRHLIMLLTPSYTQAYITDMYTNKGILVFISVIIWIIAGLGFWETVSKESIKKIVWIFAICFPALIQLFGTTELRFFLPIYLVGYFFVFASMNYSHIWLNTKGRRLRILVCMCTVLLLWITVFGDIIADNKENTLLINDSSEKNEQIYENDG